MTTEAIEKIRAAELEAENIEKTASSEAASIIEKAKADAEAMLEATVKNGEKLISDKVLEAVKTAEKIRDEKSQRLDLIIKEIEAAAQKKSDEILELVKTKLIS